MLGKSTRFLFDDLILNNNDALASALAVLLNRVVRPI